MILLSVISLLAATVRADDMLRFPSGFKIGVATSSYQIEGAWNHSDKGLNIWDHFTHQKPSPIADGSNGDIACNSFYKYKDDVAILKDLGVDFYRLSLSWSRILPNGFANKVSKDGIQYYKNLLDELNAAGIEPLVTIYQWDHPFNLEEMGGWTNELMTTWFADYANVVFRELGDKVKIFATINEPYVHCKFGYGSGIMAPGKKYPEHAPYLCMHNILKAHAKAYKIYHSEFRSTQNGQIGIVIPCEAYFPKYHNDTKSADVQYAFECGWTAHPIFSKEGDYPTVMKERIAENSKLEGYPRSRLPEFTQTEIEEIRGSADYFGLNHYSSYLTEPAPKTKDGLWYQDLGVIVTSLTKVEPEGFGHNLRHLKTLYDNPPVYVLESGLSDDGTTRDFRRIEYFHDYLRELLIAVNRDGCNVKGYSAWSFMDNFQWMDGYTQPYGLVSVDFKNPSRPRTPKLSYKWYQELIRSRNLPPPRIA